MQGVKDHFVVQNEELLRAHDNEAVDKILGASSLQEIVDMGVKFAGYDNVTHYYEDTNPINELRDILTPKLVLNAVDDVSALPQSFICHYVC
jgi:predicted alpha/beta-fold hydrolase